MKAEQSLGIVPDESKKVRCLMECSMKTISLISETGIVFNLQWANLDFEP